MGTRERVTVACLLNAKFIELWIQIKARLWWIKFYRNRNNVALRKNIILKLYIVATSNLPLIKFFMQSAEYICHCFITESHNVSR